MLLSLRHFPAGYLSVTGDSEEKDFWLGILRTEPMMTLVLSHRGDPAVDALLAAVQCIDNSEEDVSRRWDEAWNVTGPDEEMLLYPLIQALWNVPEHYSILFANRESVESCSTRQRDLPCFSSERFGMLPNITGPFSQYRR